MRSHTCSTALLLKISAADRRVALENKGLHLVSVCFTLPLGLGITRRWEVTGRALGTAFAPGSRHGRTPTLHHRREVFFFFLLIIHLPPWRDLVSPNLFGVLKIRVPFIARSCPRYLHKAGRNMEPLDPVGKFRGTHDSSR